MNKATILCLDDESVGLAVRAAVLRFAAYNVFTASSAEEALRILVEHPIDIVVSDYLLNGTTGTQVAATMKQLKPEIPILILSGVTELSDGMEFIDCFLCKLEPPPVLLATIAKLLTERDSDLDVGMIRTA